MNKSISILSILTIVGMVAATTSAIMSNQSAMAIQIGSCVGCSKDFAPGQLKKAFPIGPCDPCAKDFALGQEAKINPGTCIPCNDASQFAPGQLKKQPSTTTIG